MAKDAARAARVAAAKAQSESEAEAASSVILVYFVTCIYIEPPLRRLDSMI